MQAERLCVHFVSLGSIAFGESVIAAGFAAGLPAAEFQSVFLTSPETALVFFGRPQAEVFEFSTRVPREMNLLLLQTACEQYPPDIIVLCDFLTFFFAAPEYGLHLDDLRAVGCPIVSLDCYEWGSGDYTLDFIGGFTKRVKTTLAELDGCLRPCPLNKPAPPTAAAAAYSFLAGQVIPAVAAGEELRAGRGVGDDDLFVMSAFAPWEVTPRRECPWWPFLDVVPALIQDYLQNLERRVHWLRVGKAARTSAEVGPRLVVHDFPALPPPLFNSVLHAADVLLGTNIASTTLAKKVYYGGQAVVLYNSLGIESAQEAAALSQPRIAPQRRALLDSAYPWRPFRMFPLGWSRFLAPVLNDNPYLATFRQAEILDAADVSAAFAELDEPDGQVRRTRRQHKAEYLAALERLPAAGDCLRHFLSPAQGADARPEARSVDRESPGARIGHGP